ncbi:MAG: fluoride efflux transporter CrcB [Pseudonocardiaceae bacterium]
MPTPDRRELAAVFAGGAIGVLCRALLGEAYPAAAASWPWVTFAVNLGGAFFLGYGAIASRTGRAFPYGTLVVNLSGSVLLGLIAGLTLSNDGALLAGAAAVGSYTTFSTWMFETQRLGEDHQMLNLAANVMVSLVAGVAAAALGRLIGSHL